METYNRSMNEITLGILEKGISILKSIDMFDDQERLFFSDLTKSCITNNSFKYHKTLENNEEWTIRRRLTQKCCGIKFDSKMQQKCILFDKIIESYHCDNLGGAPVKKNKCINGKIKMCNIYYLDFWESDGDILLKNFFNIDNDNDNDNDNIDDNEYIIEDEDEDEDE